jgi:hypothetical protein
LIIAYAAIILNLVGLVDIFNEVALPCVRKSVDTSVVGKGQPISFDCFFTLIHIVYDLRKFEFS